MKIAEQLKQNNISEYILFMWQTEDLIRACSCDINIIKQKVLKDNNDEAIEQWYSKQIRALRLEGKTKLGHLNDVQETLLELNYLHGSLINLMQDEKYSEKFKIALPFIEEFKNKSDNKNISEIELCLNALYGKLILKLKGNPISSETEEAFSHFSNLLAHLSVKYKQMKSLGSL